MFVILFFIFCCLLALWLLNRGMLLTKPNLSKTELVRFEAFFLGLVNRELAAAKAEKLDLIDAEEMFLGLVEKSKNKKDNEKFQISFRDMAKMIALGFVIEKLVAEQEKKS